MHLRQESPCNEIEIQNSDIFENFEDYIKVQEINKIEEEYTKIKNEKNS